MSATAITAPTLPAPSLPDPTRSDRARGDRARADRSANRPRLGRRALLASSVLARFPLAILSVSLLVNAQRTSGSFALAGTVSGAYLICGAASAPLLGRLVDRLGQTRPLMGGAVTAAALLIITGLAPAHTPGGVLIALAAATGLATPPMQACVRAVLPALVAGPVELPRLFAVESTVIELTFVLGPPLALGLAVVARPGASLILCGATMLVGTLIFAIQPVSRDWRGRGSAGQPRRGALRAAAIRTLVLVEAGTGLVFGATEVGVTASAKHLAAAAAAGPVLGLWGAGSLIGGVIATRRGGGARTPRGLIALLAALAGLHGALVATATSLPAMGVVITLAGATIAPLAASIYEMAGRSAPAGAQAEAFSWLYAASATGAAVGAAAAGALAQATGSASAFGLAGAAGAMTVLVAAAGRLAPR